MNQEWISVDDKLPQGLLNVLVHYDDRIMGFTTRGFHSNGIWQVQSYGSKIIDAKVTHWMPLPPPPTNNQ